MPPARVRANDRYEARELTRAPDQLECVMTSSQCCASLHLYNYIRVGAIDSMALRARYAHRIINFTSPRRSDRSAREHGAFRAAHKLFFGMLRWRLSGAGCLKVAVGRCYRQKIECLTRCDCKHLVYCRAGVARRKRHVTALLQQAHVLQLPDARRISSQRGR